MDPTPTLPDLTPIGWSGADAVTKMRIEEFGTPPAEIAGERLEDARDWALEAMKFLDAADTRDLHKDAAGIVEAIDRLRERIQKKVGERS